MRKWMIIIAITGWVVIMTQDGKSTFNCESRVSDTKTVIEEDMSLLKDLLAEVKDKQKELSKLKLQKEKVEEKVNMVKTVAEWLGLNKDQICGATITIPNPYLCTKKSYVNFIKEQSTKCKKGIETGCGTIGTFLQIKNHIGPSMGTAGGSSFPPINISITLPGGNIVIGGGGSS